MTSELAFFVKLYVKPDRVAEWLRCAESIIDSMSREDAFIACYLHRDTEDPCLFTLYERWAEPSVEAWLKHQMKPYRQAYEGSWKQHGHAEMRMPMATHSPRKRELVEQRLPQCPCRLIVAPGRNEVRPLEDDEFIVNFADSGGRTRRPHHARVLLLEDSTGQHDNAAGTGDHDSPWMRTLARQRSTNAFGDDPVTSIFGANQWAAPGPGAPQLILHVTREPVNARQRGNGSGCKRELLSTLHATP